MVRNWLRISGCLMHSPRISRLTRWRMRRISIAVISSRLAVNVIAADTDAEAVRLRTSVQQAFARLRSGKPGKLPAPVDDIDAEIGPALRRGVDQALRISAVGGPASVQRQLAELVAKYQPDEVILTSQIHDHGARKRSVSIAAEALGDLAVAA